jgi:hypothetical protein
MRENVRIALGRAGCALLAGLGLALAPLPSAAGPPAPSKAAADPHAGATCSAGSSSTAEVKARVDQIQREAAQAAQNDPSAPVVLNGNGYNYGSGNPTLDDTALQFESRQPH